MMILAGTICRAQLLSLGSKWHYYDLGQSPPNQPGGVTWKEPAYDHSAWEEGRAQLGYGDSDESTPISSSTLTAYFRHTLYVQDVADFAQLSLQLLYDDGAVVYINGSEVWRVNMPVGSINYNTFASGASSDNQVVTTTVANTLINGTNTIAIEVHQSSASSSDISFDFSVSGIPASGVSVVTRGPYLQQANDTSIVIRWRTNNATASIIDYGLNTSSLTSSVSDMTPKTEHALFINDLSAATKYYYQVRNATDTLLFPSSEIYFTTYPAPGTISPLTAWILGDCGTGNNNARNVRNAYYNYSEGGHTDMMLFLGDNAYNDGTDAEYQTAIFQNMYQEKLQNTVAWACLGNHDGHSANSNAQTGPYYDIFTFPKDGECGGEASGTEAYYSFDYGNIHFVVLDSYETSRSTTGPMYMWCEDDLAATTADWVIAFWHHPAYSKGSHNSDTETALVEMRQNFLPLFESYGVDLVLSGHSHSYERTFLLHGHYGLSSTFNTAAHTVGINGSGSGSLENDEPYYKSPIGPEGGDGAAYITTGSAGKTSAAPLDHPAMYYDAVALGSCVLKINLDTLSVIFLRQSGAIDDEFMIIKDPDCGPGLACDDQDPCTVNDVFDDNCYCQGTPHLREVSTTLNAGAGSLRDAINNACDGDTILFLPSVDDTIRLSSEILIDKDLIILAQSPDSIVISAELMSRIFHVPATHELTLSGITLHAGNEAVDGGAILNEGLLILEQTEFVGNMQGSIPKAWTNHGEVRVRQGSTYLRIN